MVMEVGDPVTAGSAEDDRIRLGLFLAADKIRTRLRWRTVDFRRYRG